MRAGGAIVGLGVPSLNSVGQVAFLATLAGTSDGSTHGVFCGGNTPLTCIVRDKQTAPGTGGKAFKIFSDQSLNDSGQVVFHAYCDGGTPGIFLADPQEIIPIAFSNDTLAGSQIVDVSLGRQAINSFGQVMYVATLANHRTGAFLYTPDLHYRNSTDGNWDDPVWTVGLKPAYVHKVIIDPAANLTITGPTADTTIKSLDINCPNSFAILRLSSPARLTVGTYLAIDGGSIDLQNGVFSVLGDPSIGNAKYGQVTQNGGVFTTSGWLRLAAQPGSSANYWLGGGTLNPAMLSVAYYGSATLYQWAGNLTAPNFITIGDQPSANGSYHLDGGTLATPTLNVAWLGTATLDHTHGSATINGDLAIGHEMGSNGTYSLSGDGALHVANSGLVAVRGTGSFTQTGGSASFNTLHIAEEFNASGTVTLQAGTLSVTGQEHVGQKGSATFLHTGGTHTIAQWFDLADQPGSNATYTLANDGILNAGAPEVIAAHGTATFTQTGGTHTTAQWLTIALENDSTGTYILRGGTLNVGNDLNVSWAGHGSFIQTGGAANISGRFTIAQSTGSASATLSGGTLSATAGIFNNDTLILDGGTASGPLTNYANVSGHGTLAGPGGCTNNASFTQSGGNLYLQNTGGFTNNATMDFAAGYQAVLGANLTNQGSINLNGATISGAAALINLAGAAIVGRGVISATLVNNAGALINLDSGLLNLTKPLNNAGRIHLDSPSATLSGGPITNNGTIDGFGHIACNVSNNSILQAAGGVLDLASGLVNNASGRIDIDSGAKFLATVGLAGNVGLIILFGGSFDNNNRPLTNVGQISGFGTLSASAWNNSGTMAFTGGLATINGPLTNNAGKKVSVYMTPALFTGFVTNNGTFEVIGTTVTFAGGSSGTKAADGAKTLASVSGTGTLTVGPAATVLADCVRQDKLEIDGVVLLRESDGGSPVSRVNALEIAGGDSPTGLLDLADNALVVQATAATRTDMLERLTSQVRAARNHGSTGLWTGKGITSSVAADNSLAGLAVMVNQAADGSLLYSEFGGLPVDANSVLIGYTLNGDSNLDGKIDAVDYFRIDQGFLTRGKTYRDGDLDYSGHVDASDYCLIDEAFLRQSGSPAKPMRTAVAIPEPGVLLVGLALAGLLTRRRR